MAVHNDERDIITEFIELYRGMPCLWDISSEAYKNKSKKKNAWDVLTHKIKQLEPNANEASAKRKVEHLKSSYYRELKKVKDSKKACKKTGSASDIHMPKLWYYDLMSFLVTQNRAQKTGEHSSTSEDEDEPETRGSKKKRLSKQNTIKIKKQKLSDSDNEASKSTRKEETNTFGLYVGQKLNQIPSDQREIAEKLISDVLFLAKTNNLNFTSEIVSSSSHQTPYYTEVTPSIHIVKSSRSSSSQSPPYILASSPLHSPITPQSAASSSMTPQQNSTTSLHSEGPSGEILKELLISKK